MLEFLRRRSESHPVACLPDGMRVYAIGDIHGRSDLLHALHAAITADARSAADRRKVVVYVGDYVDRGFDSRGVVEMLVENPLDGFETVCLMGNHEASMLEFMSDIGVGPGWLQWGGDATLYSYGVTLSGPITDEDCLREAQAALRRQLPSSHLDFLRGLRLHHEAGDYLFVHAGIRPGIPIEAQLAEDLMWIRGPFLRSNADHGCVVVHGHTISREVEFRPNRIGIDTGAYASDVLPCLVLEGSERRLLNT